MKLVSMAYVAAALIGIGALIRPTTALAFPPCSTCATWWTECGQGDKTACQSFADLCMGCPENATVKGTPPTKIDSKPDTAFLDWRRFL
jgi:hypothetical protein